MKKLMIAAGAAALLAVFSFGALGEETTGTIASIDAAAGTVTLDDGKIFHMATTVALASFKVGQKVKIMFEGQAGGTLNASAITADQTTSPAPSGGNAGPTNNPGAPRD
jgi:hypothetical protein